WASDIAHLRQWCHSAEYRGAGTSPGRARYHAPMPDSKLPEHPHPRAHLALLALLAAALLFGLWGVWTVVAGGRGDAPDSAGLEGLRQQVATLARSDQVSREANQDLQGTLAERDEEVSALRADV